jgi:hypothetical protein
MTESYLLSSVSRGEIQRPARSFSCDWPYPKVTRFEAKMPSAEFRGRLAGAARGSGGSTRWRSICPPFDARWVIAGRAVPFCGSNDGAHIQRAERAPASIKQHFDDLLKRSENVEVMGVPPSTFQRYRDALRAMQNMLASNPTPEAMATALAHDFAKRYSSASNKDNAPNPPRSAG